MRYVLAVVLVLGLVVSAAAWEGRRCGDTVNIYNMVGEPEHNFLTVYGGVQQNLVQITNNWSIQGIADYYPQQNTRSDGLFVGMRITNAKPLLDLTKK